MANINHAVGIAFCTSKSPDFQKFYENEFEKRLYPYHRERLAKERNIDPDELKLYVPTPIFLLGRWDLAMISHIDSSTFHHRIFKPFHPIPKSEPGKSKSVEPQAFDYKIISGYRVSSTLNKSDDQKSPKNYGLEHPIVAFTSLKVNDMLVIGEGGNLMNPIASMILDKLNTISKETEIKYELIRTTNFAEFCLILNGKLFQDLKNAICEIRKITCSELSPKLDSTLLQRLAKRDEGKAPNGKNGNQIKIDANHPFINSDTLFGITWDTIMKPNQLQYNDQKDTGLSGTFNITIQPGHTREVIDLFRQIAIKFDATYSVAIGRRDLKLEFPDLNLNSITRIYQRILECLENKNDPSFLKTLYKSVDEIDLKLYFEEPLSSPQEFNQNIELSEPVLYQYLDKLTKLQISNSTISSIDGWLKELDVPINLKDRILNMYSNYNNIIVHPDSYIYFIDFYNFLNITVKKYIESTVKIVENSSKIYTLQQLKFDSKQVRKNLEEFCRYYSIAYNNRFFQSFKTGDLSEFHISYKGSLQQYLLIFNTLYRSFCSFLGSKSPDTESLCYVKGSAGVRSSKYTLELNVNHFNHPKTLLWVLFHEAANHFYLRLDDYVDRSENFTIEKKFINKNNYEYFRQRDQFVDNAKFFELFYLNEEELTNIENQKLVNDKVLFWIIRVQDFKREFFKNATKSTIFDQKNQNDIFNENLLHYYEKDLLTFCMGFYSDFELFSHAFWSYFLITADVYKSKREFDEDQLITVILRYLFIHKIACDHFNYENQIFKDNLEIYKDCINQLTFDTSYEDKKNSFWNDLSKITDKIYKKKVMRFVVKVQMRNINSIFKYGIFGKQQDLSKVEMTKKLKGIVNDYHVVFRINNTSKTLDSHNLISKLEYVEDKIGTFCKNNTKSFVYYNSIILGYIKSFRYGNKHEILIDQHKKAKTGYDKSVTLETVDEILENNELATILFDSNGRVVAKTEDDRLKILMQRRKLFETLWHYSYRDLSNFLYKKLA